MNGVTLKMAEKEKGRWRSDRFKYRVFSEKSFHKSEEKMKKKPKKNKEKNNQIKIDLICFPCVRMSDYPCAS